MTLPFLFALAAAALGALDVVIAARASVSAPALVSLWLLDAFTGLILGVFAALFLRAGDRVHRLFGGRVNRAVVDGLLTALPAVPLGLALFSGRGVSRTLLGEVGPYVFPALAAVAGGLGSGLLRRALRRADRGGTAARLGPAALLVLGSAALLAADRNYYPGLYTYLHVLLAFGALGLLGLAFRFLGLSPPPRRASVALAILLAFLSLPLLAASPFPNAERPVVFGNSLLLSRTAEAVWHLADLDRDGFSPLLGGGDCDDLDASVNPLGFDVTKNGVDEDCDGNDPTPFLRVAATPYRGDPGRLERLVAEAVKRPTMLIIVDALRADRVGMARFPNLARLANESLRFERAYTPATRTTLAVPAIATGHTLYSPAEPTVAERMQAAGKRTALVTIKHVSRFLKLFGGPGFTMERGFDEAIIVPDRPLRPGQVFDGLGGHIDYWTAGEVSARVVALLNRPTPPDFIWVHYFDLHQWNNLELPGAAAGLAGADRYDAALEKLDAHLGTVLEHANRFNVVLTADHGESLGEAGKMFHGGHLPREEVLVPLLIRVPGVAPAVITAPVALADLGPTLCQMTGVKGDDAWNERSFLSLAGADSPGPGPLVLMFEENEWSIVEGRWRLVLTLKSGARRLYDAEADPPERENVAGENPEITARLGRLLLQLGALARADYPDQAPFRNHAP